MRKRATSRGTASPREALALALEFVDRFANAIDGINGDDALWVRLHADFPTRRSATWRTSRASGPASATGLSYEQFMGGLIDRIPMERFGTADEVASLRAFLCSARASYITGQCLLVEGGRMEVYY